MSLRNESPDAHPRFDVLALLKSEAGSGVLLLCAAAVALVWANSPAAASYAGLWHLELFGKSLEWFVNDVLMAIFFFVVGMEIRKELHDGQLSEWRRAALPVAGALGGMLVPALTFLAFAGAPETHAGWGIPMATDIAFAVGVLALLGRRVPPALRVLLLALAVIDDLGAILVIAFFYSSGIRVSGLVVAALGIAVIVALRAAGVRRIPAYALPALAVWAGVYSAGIHPTIAGVIVGLLTPVAATAGEPESPADRLITQLHPWVSYAIMPIFAVANAGVSVAGMSLAGAGGKLSLAIMAGLVVGKPVGVLALGVLAVRLRLAVLPNGLSTRHLLVLGVVAGIGFTMSLFIAQLAFSDAALLGAAKLGVLVASVVALLIQPDSGPLATGCAAAVTRTP